MTLEWHGLSYKFIPLNVRKWNLNSYLKRQNSIPEAKSVTSKKPYGVGTTPLVARRLITLIVLVSSNLRYASFLYKIASVLDFKKNNYLILVGPYQHLYLLNTGTYFLYKKAMDATHAETGLQQLDSNV